MKTYTIEIQRLKSMSNQHGMISARIDATVSELRQRADDDGMPHSVLALSEESARVLMLLLKTQLAEFDKRKARSQR